MKRTGSDSPPRPASPRAWPQPARTPETDETESFEDSSDDPLEQAWACMEDLSSPAAEREDAIRRCIAGLPVGQRGGSFCLEDGHWKILMAITDLEAPQECAAIFAAAYLTAPGSPLASAQCLGCVNQVKAARAALAALALHKTPVGCSAVATHVLEIAYSFNVCPHVCRNLLELVFRGRAGLVADVYAALCVKIETGPRPSVWVCFVALASLHGVPGGEQLDPMAGATSLCGGNQIRQSLFISGLTQCRALLHAAQCIQCGEATEIVAADLAMMKDAMDGVRQMAEPCPEDQRGRDLLVMLGVLQAWTLSLLNQMR
ncbi:MULTISPECIES: hypothetical protein [unclassified Rhizobacter]|uniref:hypothetical protein n=1 Tax=unclassified Rhizobacter TaxID=2640088 RepID=UPI000AE29234|nr:MULTISPECIES: hypothetical protein [unclassified Rhizobacter]